MRGPRFSISLMRRGGWPAFWLLIPSACLADIHWQPVWRVELDNHPLAIETFTSRSSPDMVLRELVLRHPILERYVVAEGRILLSGLTNTVHWLAEIQPHPQGSHGYVSALEYGDRRSVDRRGLRRSKDPSSVRRFKFGSGATVLIDSHAGFASPVAVELPEE